MQADPTVENPGALLGSLKNLATLLALLVAGLYPLGLFVTNMFLLRFHYCDFNPLRAQTILTGLWSGLILTFCAAPSFLVIERTSLNGQNVRREFLQFILELIIAVGASAALTHGLLYCLGIRPFLYAAYSEVWSWIGTFLIAFGVYKLFRLIAWREQCRSKATSHGLSLAAVLAVFAAVMVCAYSLSQTIYPRVDVALGGGKPQLANLVLNTDGAEFWRKITTQEPPNGMLLSGYVYIYHETGNELLLRLCECIRPQGDVVVMKKSLVAGIIPEYRDPLSITAATARPVPVSVVHASAPNAAIQPSPKKRNRTLHSPPKRLSVR